jgi:hypothetical protein
VDPPALDEKFVITVTGPRTFPVQVMLPAGSVEKTVSVLDSEFEEVARVPTSSGTATIPLFRAKYLVQLVETGEQKKVDVAGTGGVHVQF